jgi:hypothetical protein
MSLVIKSPSFISCIQSKCKENAIELKDNSRSAYRRIFKKKHSAEGLCDYSLATHRLLKQTLTRHSFNQTWEGITSTFDYYKALTNINITDNIERESFPAEPVGAVGGVVGAVGPVGGVVGGAVGPAATVMVV